MRDVGLPDVRIGVADGPFTAEQAARGATTPADPIRVVPEGAASAFLAPLSVAALADVAPQAEIMLMGAEDPGALIHAPNESVDLEELERMVLAEALLLARLGGLLSE